MIGFATKRFSAPDTFNMFSADNYPVDQLTFLGMCAIMDPPRDDAEVAIRDCKVQTFCEVL